jgi:hypothetical protein
LHLALSQLAAARFRYLDSYLRHFNNGLFSFSSSIHTSTEYIQTFSRLSVINLDAKSTQLLKSEHHKAVWSLCLNILTDRPLQSTLTYLCFVRPSVDQFYLRLARFPLTMTKYLVYHHVYSYVVASKNFYSSYPATTQDTRLSITRMVGLIAFGSPDKFVITPKSMRVIFNPLIKLLVPRLILLPRQSQ